MKRFVGFVNVYSSVGLYTFSKTCRALHLLHFVHHLTRWIDTPIDRHGVTATRAPKVIKKTENYDRVSF